MKTVAKDGKVYAEITLRDVVERSDVSSMPMLTEIKRLYEENDRMHGMLQRLYGFAYDENPDGAELNFADELRELEIEVPR